MLKALVYVYVDCPRCGESLPLKAWIVESGYDEDGHAEELEVEVIECCRCGVLEDGEGLEELVDDVLEALYSGEALVTGEILSYHPRKDKKAIG